MVVVKVLDYVSDCYSNSDGDVIKRAVIDHIALGNMVTVSFEGVDSVSSSFVNSAFIELLEVYPFDLIQQQLRFTNSTKVINEVIKKRFLFEVNERKKLIKV